MLTLKQEPSTFATSTSPVATSSAPPPSTTAPTSANMPSVYTSVYTVTGQRTTVVITPSATADATLGQGATTRGGGLSKGAVVGIVVGVAIAIGLLVAWLVWLFLKRKHSRQQAVAPAPYVNDSDRSNGVPSRQVSQMSSAGLLAGKLPRINTNSNSAGGNGRSPGNDLSAGDRRSLGTDQRLNPYAIYSYEESRSSNISLQDNQDYSRQLRVANPDY